MNNLAFAGGGAFRTLEPTAHTRTHCDVIRKFLDITVGCEQIANDIYELRIDASEESPDLQRLRSRASR